MGISCTCTARVLIGAFINFSIVCFVTGSTGRLWRAVCLLISSPISGEMATNSPMVRLTDGVQAAFFTTAATSISRSASDTRLFGIFPFSGNGACPLFPILGGPGGLTSRKGSTSAYGKFLDGCFRGGYTAVLGKLPASFRLTTLFFLGFGSPSLSSSLLDSSDSLLLSGLIFLFGTLSGLLVLAAAM